MGDFEKNMPSRTDRKVSRTRALAGSAPIFAALGDSTRLRIIATLSAGGALPIAQLTARTAVTRQAVTKHLHVLAEAGLVQDLRREHERLWESEPSRLEQACLALESIAADWDRALQRLRRFVEP